MVLLTFLRYLKVYSTQICRDFRYVIFFIGSFYTTLFIITSLVKDNSSRLIFKIFYFAALGDFLLLGWLSQSPVKKTVTFLQVNWQLPFILFSPPSVFRSL